MTLNPPAPACRGVFLARTVSNTPICAEHFRLVLEIERFPDAAPGQFVQILCSDPLQRESTSATFIRRPFSIGGLRRAGERCEIDIYHRVVGAGTRWMSRLQPGDPVDLLGPLGKPFQLEAKRSTALLAGGGIGLPPLIWLAQAMQQAHKRTIVFVGGRSADQIPLTRDATVAVSPLRSAPVYREFAQFGATCVVATNDGSLGSAGYIPEAFNTFLDQQPDLATDAVVYTCGPDPMMRAIAPHCERRGMPCHVCLERVMACGMGTCQSCVVAVSDPAATDGWRYRLCCTDGPVFDSRDVVWSHPH